MKKAFAHSWASLRGKTPIQSKNSSCLSATLSRRLNTAFKRRSCTTLGKADFSSSSAKVHHAGGVPVVALIVVRACPCCYVRTHVIRTRNPRYSQHIFLIAGRSQTPCEFIQVRKIRVGDFKFKPYLPKNPSKHWQISITI
jgi:hypothetical protein